MKKTEFHEIVKHFKKGDRIRIKKNNFTSVAIVRGERKEYPHNYKSEIKTFREISYNESLEFDDYTSVHYSKIKALEKN